MNVIYFNKAVNATEGAAIHAREVLESLTDTCDHVLAYPVPRAISYAKAGAEKGEAGARLCVRELLRLVRGVLRSVKDLFCLLYLSWGRRYDFVFSRSFEYSVAGVFYQWFRGVPLILEINALQYKERERYGGGIFLAIRKVFERFVIEKASATYVVSQALVELLKSEGIHPRRVSVIENGVNVGKFSPDTPKAQVYEGSELAGKTIVGFTGSLKPWHGVDTAIQAMQHVLPVEPDVMLVIVGDGNEGERLRALCNSLGLQGAVKFLGRVEHEAMPRFVSGFDLALAPYAGSDNFYFSPLKVYEYLAAGVPTIASDVGDLRALLVETGAGTCVHAGDAHMLADAICALKRDAERLQGMRQAARDVAMQHSWHSVAERILQMGREAAQ